MSDTPASWLVRTSKAKKDLRAAADEVNKACYAFKRNEEVTAVLNFLGRKIDDAIGHLDGE